MALALAKATAKIGPSKIHTASPFSTDAPSVPSTSAISPTEPNHGKAASSGWKTGAIILVLILLAIFAINLLRYWRYKRQLARAHRIRGRDNITLSMQPLIDAEDRV